MQLRDIGRVLDGGFVLNYSGDDDDDHDDDCVVGDAKLRQASDGTSLLLMRTMYFMVNLVTLAYLSALLYYSIESILQHGRQNLCAAVLCLNELIPFVLTLSFVQRKSELLLEMSLRISLTICLGKMMEQLHLLWIQSPKNESLSQLLQ